MWLQLLLHLAFAERLREATAFVSKLNVMKNPFWLAYSSWVSVSHLCLETKSVSSSSNQNPYALLSLLDNF